jgi:hypothetical protein
MSFALFTSIRPPADADALEYLRLCVNSWQTAGFDIVAVNGPAESDALARLDLPVEFHRLAHDGKPRIGEILGAIRARSCPYAGIINADCKLIDYPDLLGNLQRNLAGRAVLAWRIDIAENTAPAPTLYGYDAFFFDTKFIPSDDLDFHIGEPGWDIWFPVALALSGGAVETLAVPLMTHRVHALNWSPTAYARNGNRLWRMLKSCRERLDVRLRAKIPESMWRWEQLDDDQIAYLNRLISAWLLESPREPVSILPPPFVHVENVLRMGCTAMAAAADTADLSSITNSTIWRMTKPLRVMIDFVRFFVESGKRMVPIDHR